MSDYRIINYCFVVILFLGFSYCFFLKSVPADIQIKSNCDGDLYCKSVGLTRAFNSVLHLDFEQAKSYNPNFYYPFCFFLSQFFYRIIISFKREVSHNFITIEIILSILFFLFSFTRFILP